jgi:hypothetical protein
MCKRIRRIHALTNTFSGIAGEARIAAEFVRCGFRVAKPYWSDDEVDLLVLQRSSQPNIALPLSIQVKSVQFLPQKDGTLKDHVFIQGLKKRYVTKSPAFGLAIYRVDTDEIFFIDGQANVQAIYESQSSWNKKHVSFGILAEDKDVRIAVHFDDGLKGDWKVDPDSPSWLTARMKRIVENVERGNFMAQVLDAMWDDHPETVEVSDEEVSNIEQF